jgi:ATP-dependent Clp protease adaptor protein ClpS
MSTTVVPTTPDVLRDVRQLRPHKVIVLDCQCHSFDDVEHALCRVIPRMTRSRAHEHAWEIHTTGASVVATAALEQAELFCSQLATYGLRVTVEEDS